MKYTDVTVTKKHGSFPEYYDAILKNQNGYNIAVGISRSPTHNCQLGSIGSFNNIIRQMSNNEDMVNMIKKISAKSINKLLFIIDIKEAYNLAIYNKLLKDNPDDIISVFKKRYVSTNGSKMVTCMFKLTNLNYKE